jgi:hypothetical protein
MKYISFILLVLMFVSCEEEYIPEDVFDEPEISVEGYIEYGDSAMPPYVILTRSFPYTGTLTPAMLNELFIHNAVVKVTDGVTEVQLTEVCLNSIAVFDSTLAQVIAQSIGFGNVDISTLNYCIYVDIGAFLGGSLLTAQMGRTYNLSIIADGDTVTASTTIPMHIPMDTIFYVNHPDFPTNDSLVEIRGRVTDPGSRVDYYRILTKRNSEPMYPLFGGSVTDDKIFNGRQFEFPIQRGQSITNEFDQNTFGYFWRGDTVIIRQANIDYEQFRFWQTLEYNTNSSGPFSSYVRIESNIKGGLGIWGGVSISDKKVIIQ